MRRRKKPIKFLNKKPLMCRLGRGQRRKDGEGDT